MWLWMKVPVGPDCRNTIFAGVESVVNLSEPHGSYIKLAIGELVNDFHFHGHDREIAVGIFVSDNRRLWIHFFAISLNEKGCGVVSRGLKKKRPLKVTKAQAKNTSLVKENGRGLPIVRELAEKVCVSPGRITTVFSLAA